MLVPKPDTPVLIGSPVALVNVPDDGVPSAGVVRVGDVNVLFVSVCDPVSVATVESIAIVPEEEIVPPLRPVPAVMLVTVPVAA